jgi:hypothetical protein
MFCFCLSPRSACSARTRRHHVGDGWHASYIHTCTQGHATTTLLVIVDCFNNRNTRDDERHSVPECVIREKYLLYIASNSDSAACRWVATAQPLLVLLVQQQMNKIRPFCGSLSYSANVTSPAELGSDMTPHGPNFEFKVEAQASAPSTSSLQRHRDAASRRVKLGESLTLPESCFPNPIRDT